MGFWSPEYAWCTVWQILPNALQKNGFANFYPHKEGMKDQFLYIQAKPGHHQSFKFLPICRVIMSFPFNLQGHIHLPPAALLRLLAADSQKQSAGGEMRSRPKSIFPFRGRGVYLGKYVPWKVSLWFERKRNKVQELPFVIVCLNLGAPMHWWLHCNQLYCVMCSSVIYSSNSHRTLIQCQVKFYA